MPAVVGQPAPDFSLRDQSNNTVSLADLKGQKALIVFIPFPFTGTCDGEACALRDDLGALEPENAWPNDLCELRRESERQRRTPHRAR